MSELTTTETHPLLEHSMHRIGRYSIPRSTVERADHTVRAFMHMSVVVSASFEYDTQTIDYLALSPYFEPVPKNGQAPWYDLLLLDGLFANKRIRTLRFVQVESRDHIPTSTNSLSASTPPNIEQYLVSNDKSQLKWLSLPSATPSPSPSPSPDTVWTSPSTTDHITITDNLVYTGSFTDNDINLNNAVNTDDTQATC